MAAVSIDAEFTVDQNSPVELVWLGDVESGNYATTFSSPVYKRLLRAQLKGEQLEDPITDGQQVLNVLDSARAAVRSRFSTGFLAASDFALLDTETVRDANRLKEAGGTAGISTLLSLATPRREVLRRQLLGETSPKGAAQGGQDRSREYQPMTQALLYAIDQFSAKRQRARQRRRALIGRRYWELRYEAQLRRGGEPFHGKRILARSGTETEGDVPVEGEVYYERGSLCTYWYDTSLRRWNRLVGSTPAGIRARAIATRRRQISSVEVEQQNGELRPMRTFTSMTAEEIAQSLFCRDTTGARVLRYHQAFIEYKYAALNNKGACEGLCRFHDGWLVPEGIDGISTNLDLSFSPEGEYLATHSFCAACNVRLCRKCQVTLLQHHRGNLREFVECYHQYRDLRGVRPTYAQYIESRNDLPLDPAEDPNQSFKPLDVQPLADEPSGAGATAAEAAAQAAAERAAAERAASEALAAQREAARQEAERQRNAAEEAARNARGATRLEIARQEFQSEAAARLQQERHQREQGAGREETEHLQETERVNRQARQRADEEAVQNRGKVPAPPSPKTYASKIILA
ncbi:hypothetical protein BDZ91DRAFT_15921 [Kalaharituber pfeilii]|nr:hypothetical protein BDZ91DRAFT_15921 [Kalaharituber pfeilii]